MTRVSLLVLLTIVRSLVPVEAHAQQRDGDDESLGDSPPQEERWLLSAYAEVGSPYRSLAFNDPLTSPLSEHELAGAPMFGTHAFLYPMQAFRDDWMSWIGLEAGLQIAVNTSTVDSEGNEFDSQYANYLLGLVGRIPVREHAMLVYFGYAMNQLSIEPKSDDVDRPAPNVEYRMLRPGVGGELAASDSLTLGANAAWLVFLSVGEIANWFPRSTAGGFEVSAYAQYGLGEYAYLRAAADYWHAFFDFNSEPGDDNIAGGAVDQYLALSIGVGLEL